MIVSTGCSNFFALENLLEQERLSEQFFELIFPEMVGMLLVFLVDKKIDLEIANMRFFWEVFVRLVFLRCMNWAKLMVGKIVDMKKTRRNCKRFQEEQVFPETTEEFSCKTIYLWLVERLIPSWKKCVEKDCWPSIQSLLSFVFLLSNFFSMLAEELHRRNVFSFNLRKTQFFSTNTLSSNVCST